jgi:ATP/maltotriose-dependent transcriptional regulator MalT
MRDSASVPEEHLLVAANKAVATFTAHGQTARLAEALRAAAQAHLFLGNGTAARVAAEQARGAAEAAKDEREEGLALCDLVISLPWGPTPADEVATEAERVLALAKGRRRLRPQGFALVALGYAQALQGDFERASSTIGSALEVLREISPLWAAGMGAQICGLISLLANDSRAARAALEEGLDRLEQMDESGFLSTNAAMLAHVAHAEGDNERAEALVERARATAAVDDVLSQMLWRTALAKVEARRGRLDDAELLAREAVSIGAHTDYIATRADCLADLAELLRLAGKSDGASAALEQALALYGQKGNVVMAERARARLAALRLATARAQRA